MTRVRRLDYEHSNQFSRRTDTPTTVGRQDQGLPKRQFDITGTWYSEEYDEADAWATSYRTIFNPDGTVLQIGWRNEDHGTYEVSADGMYVTAYFKGKRLHS